MNFRLYLIIIFFLVTGVLGYFLVWPAYQEISSIQLEIEEIKIGLQEGEEYFAGLRSLSRKLEQYQDEISILDTALPKKVYLPLFYDFFPEVCSRQGLLYQGISVSFGGSEGEGIKEIPISLSVSGDYSSFRSLLSYFESSVRFFSIENVSLSSAQGGEFFSASLAIKTYSY